MRLGIGSYTYAWNIGIGGFAPPQPMRHQDVLDQAITFGADVVQFCENLSLDGLPESELDALVKRAAAHQIRFEVGTRGLDPARLIRHASLAAQVGASFVRLVIDGDGREPTPEEAVDELRKLVPEFASRGLKIGIENHDRFPARVLSQMVEAIGTDHCGVVLDTANSLGCLEGPEYVVKTLARFTINLHIKDVRARRIQSLLGLEILGTAAGQGQLDIPWIVGQVQQDGRAESAILENWTYSDGTPATFARERAEAEEGWAYLRQSVLPANAR